MEKFRGVDYYAIEGLLSEEERMIRDAVRDFVEVEALPLIEGHHRAGTFPLQLIPKIGELGIFGATSRATAAPGSATSPTGSSCRSWSAATPGSARWRRCRAALVMYADLHLRLRGAEGEWLPAMAAGRADRLLRPHRARPRLGSRAA